MNLYDNDYDYCRRCGIFTFLRSDKRCDECHEQYIREIDESLGDIVK